MRSGGTKEMALKQVMEIYELLDSARVNGEQVAQFLKNRGIREGEVIAIKGDKGITDSIKIQIPGATGRRSGGPAPTLGIIGRLGGIGARPQMIGLVSDGDGAIAALSVALKLADMKERGDALPGDVIVATHICPNAPTTPHEPVPFMGSPVDMKSLNAHEVDSKMEAILSIDATKGNRIINQRGFAISPTVKGGYILKVSQDLLTLMEIATGRRPAVLCDYDPGHHPLWKRTIPSQQHNAAMRGDPGPGGWRGDHGRVRCSGLRHRSESCC